MGVPGKFSVYNSLCALSVAAFYEIPFSLSFPALEKVHVIGRTEPVKHPKGKVPVIIDYAHNALSLQSLFGRGARIPSEAYHLRIRSGRETGRVCGG